LFYFPSGREESRYGARKKDEKEKESDTQSGVEPPHSKFLDRYYVRRTEFRRRSRPVAAKGRARMLYEIEAR